MTYEHEISQDPNSEDRDGKEDFTPEAYNGDLPQALDPLDTSKIAPALKIPDEYWTTSPATDTTPGDQSLLRPAGTINAGLVRIDSISLGKPDITARPTISTPYQGPEGGLRIPLPRGTDRLVQLRQREDENNVKTSLWIYSSGNLDVTFESDTLPLNLSPTATDPTPGFPSEWEAIIQYIGVKRILLPTGAPLPLDELLLTELHALQRNHTNDRSYTLTSKHPSGDQLHLGIESSWSTDNHVTLLRIADEGYLPVEVELTRDTSANRIAHLLRLLLTPVQVMEIMIRLNELLEVGYNELE